jgi:short-subunit dehydrogenase
MTNDRTPQEVTIITGASAGIGEATAKLLASRGHRLVLVARRNDRLETIAAEIGAATGHPERVLMLAADVAAPSAASEAVGLALDRFGTVTALVNNAGYGAFGPLTELTDAQWQHQFDVNVMGCVRFAREALHVMLPAGRGTIVNVSSVAGSVTFATGAAYCASKHALEGLTGCLREEVRDQGVRVTLVCPGSVATGFFASADGKFKGEDRAIDSDWMISPAEIARAIASAIECEANSFHARIEVRPLRRGPAKP